MGRITAKMLPTLSAIHKRFYQVYLDEGSNQQDLAKSLGLTQSYISRLLTGEYGITDKVIRPVCSKLGYSAEWFVLGKGNKKAKAENTKLVTEIQQLRTDYAILQATVARLEARMKSYEEK